MVLHCLPGEAMGLEFKVVGLFICGGREEIPRLLPAILLDNLNERVYIVPRVG